MLWVGVKRKQENQFVRDSCGTIILAGRQLCGVVESTGLGSGCMDSKPASAV